VCVCVCACVCVCDSVRARRVCVRGGILGVQTYHSQLLNPDDGFP
jgi:hypothetical protein